MLDPIPVCTIVSMGTFFCVSAPSLVKEETLLLTKSWGFSAPYLDKLVKHTESMWDWAVKISDYTN